MTGERVNREPFRIVEHEGRQQPWTVWRGNEVWWFTTTYYEAMCGRIQKRLEWEAARDG